MAKIRIYELAKELGIEDNKELVAYVRGLGIEIKGVMSTLDDDQAEKVRRHLATLARRHLALATALVKKLAWHVTAAQCIQRLRGQRIYLIVCRNNKPGITQQAIFQAINPAMHCQCLITRPAIAHHGRSRDIDGLFQHIQFTQTGPTLLRIDNVIQ